jgi:hypothetical protein
MEASRIFRSICSSSVLRGLVAWAWLFLAGCLPGKRAPREPVGQGDQPLKPPASGDSRGAGLLRSPAQGGLYVTDRHGQAP